MTNCLLEFFDSEGKLTGMLYQVGNGAPETPDSKRGSGVLCRLHLLEVFLANLPDKQPKWDNPEWAAAEYISMFRGLGDGGIYVVNQRKQDAAYLYKIRCGPDKMRIEVHRQVGHSRTYRKVA